MIDKKDMDRLWDEYGERYEAELKGKKIHDRDVNGRPITKEVERYVSKQHLFGALSQLEQIIAAGDVEERGSLMDTFIYQQAHPMNNRSVGKLTDFMNEYLPKKEGKWTAEEISTYKSAYDLPGWDNGKHLSELNQKIQQMSENEWNDFNTTEMVLDKYSGTDRAKFIAVYVFGSDPL